MKKLEDWLPYGYTPFKKNMDEETELLSESINVGRIARHNEEFIATLVNEVKLLKLETENLKKRVEELEKPDYGHSL
jgi:regulator of replication initiation timing